MVPKIMMPIMPKNIRNSDILPTAKARGFTGRLDKLGEWKEGTNTLTGDQAQAGKQFKLNL